MSIVTTIANLVTPQMMAQIAKLIGAQPELATKAMGTAVPALLSGLLSSVTSNKASTDKFADALAQQKSPGSGNLWSTFATDPKQSATAGADLMSSLLGGGAGALTSGLESYTGLSGGAARSVMGLAGSVIMGALGKTASEKGLDAAGVINMLQGEKDEIARAIPGDFADKIEGSGLLSALSDRMDLVRGPAEVRDDPAATPAAAPVRTAPPPRPSTPPPAPGRPWWQWLLGLLILLALLWWLLGSFGGEEEVVAPVEEPAVVEEEAEVVEEAPPAETEVVEEAAGPLVVDGVDVGETLTSSISDLEGALSGITDAASAEAALPTLTGISDRLSGIDAAVQGLPEAARAQVSEIVGGALPSLQTTVSELLENGDVAGILQPMLDAIMAQLTAFAG